MVATTVRRAATSVAQVARGDPNNWQEYDPANFSVDAGELADQLREELGSQYSVNVNKARKVVVHRL